MKSIEYIKHHFDFESPQPPGTQLAVVVVETIKAGVLAPGDPLPTEREFCDALLLPRSAVREAMEILRTSGEITRMAGLGTFVAPSFMRRQLDSVYDFTRSVKAEGMEPSTKVLLFQRTYPAGFSSRTLDLPLDEPSIFRIERLRYADGVPMSLEIEHIPCLRFPDLAQADVSGSLYEMLAHKYGVQIGDADEYYQAILLGKREAKLLDRQYRSPAFRIVRVVRDTSGQVFNITEAFVPGDHTRLGVHLEGRTPRTSTES